MLALLLISLQGPPVDSAVQRVSVKPSVTDKAIDSFDFEHTAFLNPKAAKRDELVIFLPGTGGKSTLGSSEFCEAAANRGYHVVSLMYPNDVSATSVAGDKDPDALLNF